MKENSSLNSIDRTLHSTSATDEGIDSAVYVQNKIAEEFSDSHVWFSVAARPPRYRFTRVQRLSCCLALLLTSMLASAMFYQHEAIVDDTQGSLRMGRFDVNLKGFIIGVQSLIVIFPTYVLTVELFAHTRSSDENKQMTLKTNAEKESFSLPQWFIFIPWLLCFLLSTCAAAFVLFYSLQWGADTSEQWLASVAISIFVDIFVVEPIQIIVVAFILPHIFKEETNRSTWMPRSVDPEVDLKDIKVGVFVCILVYNYGRIRELSRGKFDLGHFMFMKMKELLGCRGDRQGANEEISGYDLPSTEIEEDILPEAAEILARLDRINHLLNVHYAEEFCEDLELFSMWFDLRMQAKKSKDLQENWVDAQESFEAAVEEDWVDAHQE